MITTFELKPFNNLVLFIIKKRSLFGIIDLESLKVFFNGYEIALHVNSFEKDDEWNIFKNEFDDYVHGYYNTQSTNDWCGLILENTKTVKESFEKFEELFDLFVDSVN
jgi:hypothetical protein